MIEHHVLTKAFDSAGPPSPLAHFDAPEARFAEWEGGCDVLLSGLAGSGNRDRIHAKIRDYFEKAFDEFDGSVVVQLEEDIVPLDEPG